MKKFALLAIAALAAGSAYATDAEMNNIDKPAEKAGAMNAPVMQKVKSHAFDCEDGTQVISSFADLNHITLSVDGKLFTLDKTSPSSWRTFGVIHNPTENDYYETFETQDGLGGKYTEWTQRRYDATLDYIDDAGMTVRLHCQAK